MLGVRVPPGLPKAYALFCCYVTGFIAREALGKMSKIISFLQEVKAELTKVTWPKREDLVGAVIIVCMLAIFFALLIGLMDTVVGVAIRWLIR